MCSLLRYCIVGGSEADKKPAANRNLMESGMNAKTRLQSFASFSRWTSVTTMVLLLCVSAMASDDRGFGVTGQSYGQDAARGAADSDSKSEASDSALPIFDVNCDLCSNPSMPKDKASGPAKAPSITGREKFRYFFTRSFLSPTPYATAIVAGAFGEWIDDDHHHHSKAGDFAADSMTRAARSFAFGATTSFFEKFAYASIFKQDPRYYKSEKRGAGARIAYAVSRLFVTRSDQGARQFNISFIAGGLTGAAISNVWERDDRRNTQDTMKRWGIHLGVTAVSNIFHEFVGKR